MPGRNDPCPCGSGKKYKQCCLAKDQEKWTPPAPMQPSLLRQAETDDEPEDPQAALREARWAEFESGRYPQQLELFQRTLDEGLMDGFNAVEMGNALYDAAINHGEPERFLGLVEALRRQAPAAFDENAVSFLSWQVEIALALGREADLPELTRRLGESVHADLDLFQPVEEQLAYHGRLDLLLPTLRRAWPEVRDSVDLLEWAIDEYASYGVDLEIFAYLEADPQGESTNPDLLQRARFFIDDLDEEHFTRCVDLLAGRLPISEQRPDYVPSGGKKPAKRLPPGVRKRMIDLSLAFLGEARRSEGVPWTKAALGRSGLFGYLLGQADSQSRKGRPLQHPLCPERASLDEYLGGEFSVLSFPVHKVLATFELVPAWLRFLRRHQLLTADEHQSAFENLKPLRGSLLGLLKKSRHDPRLGEGLSAWDTPPG